jgi:hypothetical protein
VQKATKTQLKLKDLDAIVKKFQNKNKPRSFKLVKSIYA